MEKSISISPIIAYPRQACVGKTYLMTIDLECPMDQGWPYKEEEYAIYCMLSTPLFTSKIVNEPAIVLHRFGGTYGPANFFLTACDKPQIGSIQVHLANQWGVPLQSIHLPVEIQEQV